MTDITAMKIVANVLFSMQAMIEAALIVIQERINAAEGTSQAKGPEDVSGVLGKIQEASAGLAKTFGGRTYPKPGAPVVESAKGSEPTSVTDQPTLARSSQ